MSAAWNAVSDPIKFRDGPWKFRSFEYTLALNRRSPMPPRRALARHATERLASAYIDLVSDDELEEDKPLKDPAQDRGARATCDDDDEAESDADREDAAVSVSAAAPAAYAEFTFPMCSNELNGLLWCDDEIEEAAQRSIELSQSSSSPSASSRIEDDDVLADSVGLDEAVSLPVVLSAGSEEDFEEAELFELGSIASELVEFEKLNGKDLTRARIAAPSLLESFKSQFVMISSADEMCAILFGIVALGSTDRSRLEEVKECLQFARQVCEVAIKFVLRTPSGFWPFDGPVDLNELFDFSDSTKCGRLTWQSDLNLVTIMSMPKNVETRSDLPATETPFFTESSIPPSDSSGVERCKNVFSKIDLSNWSDSATREDMGSIFCFFLSLADHATLGPSFASFFFLVSGLVEAEMDSIVGPSEKRCASPSETEFVEAEVLERNKFAPSRDISIFVSLDPCRSKEVISFGTVDERIDFLERFEVFVTFLGAFCAYGGNLMKTANLASLRLFHSDLDEFAKWAVRNGISVPRVPSWEKICQEMAIQTAAFAFRRTVKRGKKRPRENTIKDLASSLATEKLVTFFEDCVTGESFRRPRADENTFNVYSFDEDIVLGLRHSFFESSREGFPTLVTEPRSKSADVVSLRPPSIDVSRRPLSVTEASITSPMSLKFSSTPTTDIIKKPVPKKEEAASGGGCGGGGDVVPRLVAVPLQNLPPQYFHAYKRAIAAKQMMVLAQRMVAAKKGGRLAP